MVSQLCRNMVHCYQTGLRNWEPVLRERLYDRYDLEGGAEYAEGWMQEGYTTDLISGFDLDNFREWCEKKLKQSSYRKPRLA